MDSKTFVFFRKKLKKTQAKMAQLLGVSLKAVHSYEQGWRSIPGHVERQLLFLVAKKKKDFQKNTQPCWEILDCPEEKRRECPAWEFDGGELCWFIGGTICQGLAQKTWDEKKKICKNCEASKGILEFE